jgi:hypothetical protein
MAMRDSVVHRIDPVDPLLSTEPLWSDFHHGLLGWDVSLAGSRFERGKDIPRLVGMAQTRKDMASQRYQVAVLAEPRRLPTLRALGGDVPSVPRLGHLEVANPQLRSENDCLPRTLARGRMISGNKGLGRRAWCMPQSFGLCDGVVGRPAAAC